MYIDSFFYGKTVIAPLGIVLYNVFGKGGPNLYGEIKQSFALMHTGFARTLKVLEFENQNSRP